MINILKKTDLVWHFVLLLFMLERSAGNLFGNTDGNLFKILDIINLSVAKRLNSLVDQSKALGFLGWLRCASDSHGESVS